MGLVSSSRSGWFPKTARVVCPNFRHHALTPSFKKYKFLQVKNSLQHLWMNFQFWNCLSFRMAIYCFRSMTYSLYKMRKPRMTKLGQGVGVRAHYPTIFLQFFIYNVPLPSPAKNARYLFINRVRVYEQKSPMERFQNEFYVIAILYSDWLY